MHPNQPDQNSDRVNIQMLKMASGTLNIVQASPICSLSSVAMANCGDDGSLASFIVKRI